MPNFNFPTVILLCFQIVLQISFERNAEIAQKVDGCKFGNLSNPEKRKLEDSVIAEIVASAIPLPSEKNIYQRICQFYNNRRTAKKIYNETDLRRMYRKLKKLHSENHVSTGSILSEICKKGTGKINKFFPSNFKHNECIHSSLKIRFLIYRFFCLELQIGNKC